MRVPNLRDSLGQEIDTVITEEHFTDISSILIGIAINLNESCHTELVMTNETVNAYHQDVVRMFRGTADTLQLEAIQDMLEHINIGEE